MLKFSRPAWVLAAAAAVLLTSSCQKTDTTTQRVSQKDVNEVAKILADTAGMMKPAAAPVNAVPANVVFTKEDIPHEGGYLNIVVGDLTDAQANKFLRRLKTENCTCGCPHTIDQCLIEDPQCDVAPRLATQVLKEVTGGI